MGWLVSRDVLPAGTAGRFGPARGLRTGRLGLVGVHSENGPSMLPVVGPAIFPVVIPVMLVRRTVDAHFDAMAVSGVAVRCVESRRAALSCEGDERHGAD